MYRGSSFDVREAVHVALSLLAKAAAAKGLLMLARVDDDVPALLRGDPGCFRQVVAHLVSVAIKFSKTGGVDVHVSVGLATPLEVVVLIGVHGTGLDVPAEILERFFPRHSDASAVAPLGIGRTERSLAIARRVVQKMDGDVCVTQGDGNGATLWFTARLHRTLGQPVPWPVASDSNRKGLRS
jgi:signal transduction histidine kinase